MGKHIKVVRETSESIITINLDREERDPDAKKKLRTPLPFFNHMLEHVQWRSQTNFSVEVELDHFDLVHLITEDVGITLGRAYKDYVDQHLDDGLVGYGFAYGTIDEALTRAVVSFESRAYLDFQPGEVELPEAVEGMHSEDLIAFLEGFVQGAMCTLHIDLIKGRSRHGHHIWEATFRAFGMTLYEALAPREWRQHMTAGVAGSITMRTEVQ